MTTFPEKGGGAGAEETDILQAIEQCAQFPLPNVAQRHSSLAAGKGSQTAVIAPIQGALRRSPQLIVIKFGQRGEFGRDLAQ